MIPNNMLVDNRPAPVRCHRGGARRRPKNKLLWQIIGGLIVVLFLAVLVKGISNYPFWSQAVVTAVDPPTGMPGEILTMLGRDLGKSKVAEVYLTDGKSLWMAEIVHQSGKDIRFRIPASAGSGTLHIVLTTPGLPVRWIDQSPSVIVPPTKH